MFVWKLSVFGGEIFNIFECVFVMSDDSESSLGVLSIAKYATFFNVDNEDQTARFHRLHVINNAFSRYAPYCLQRINCVIA